MTSRADQVARNVILQFSKLPPRRKPTVRGNGLHEWVPLSGIVLEKDGNLECVALATGMKCLPASKIRDANGIVLHDWHAEILAIRTFNRFLLDECQALLEGGSNIVERIPRHSAQATRPFRIKDDVKILMYCSEAPCGDASIELTMAAQEDATPWKLSPSPLETEITLAGREGFSHLGIVRRKPARRDAPPTLSKSCSDKLALKQCTSLLSSLTSLFIEPRNAYLETVVVPSSQYTAAGFQRAFSKEGRMSPLKDVAWAEQYGFMPVTIEITALEFEYSKRCVADISEKISASSIAAAWSGSGVEETIVGGVIQGSKTTEVRGASRVSRRRMWESARELISQLVARQEGYDDLLAALHTDSYHQVKDSELLAERRQVVADAQVKALKGWVKNYGDSSFSLDKAAVSVKR